MKNQNQNQVIFYTIRSSTIKKFIILEGFTGTGIYYGLKLLTSSVLAGVIGSVVCIEIIKKIPFKNNQGR
ncbi:hypothetical protein [Metabacillus endolithicus]|uniref:Uncharacterized protein n=1 Tax=Metabacillus endolithicus TaxID=1535204 RepID=A0ABW5BZK0_9BACI|nr:hypothetical protein [Metabacillus endolithicus]UPG62584.1 hypothetical protein MVE64_19255 [Metabacillus endolithicus]